MNEERMKTESSTTGTPGQGLFGATLGFFIGFAAVALFGPTAKKFKDVMDLSPLAVGVLVATPALSGSLLRVPFAAWVDTTGGRKPFLVLLGTSLVGMLGITTLVYTRYPSGLTPGMYPLLLVLGVLCGCGIATFSVGIGQVSYWFPKAKQGGALGVFGGAGNLAPGVFSFILPFALAHLGLAGSYLTWLVFLGIGTVLYYFAGRNAWYFQLVAKGRNPEQAREQSKALGQEMFPMGGTKESLRLSAKSWKTWVLVGLYFTTFGGFLALTAWLPTYWREYLQQSEVVAGLLTGTYAVLASLVRVGAGKLTDRLGGEKTLVFGLVAMATGGVIVGIGSGLPLAITGIVIMAVGMGTGNAAVFKLVPQEVPQAVGGAAGWVGGLGAFGGFALPPLMAVAVRVFGTAGYAYGFLVFVGLAVASVGLLFLLQSARPVAIEARAADGQG
jgi:MFS transporter, NNP family, nitrate/nitrite transporter